MSQGFIHSFFSESVLQEIFLLVSSYSIETENFNGELTSKEFCFELSFARLNASWSEYFKRYQLQILLKSLTYSKKLPRLRDHLQTNTIYHWLCGKFHIFVAITLLLLNAATTIKEGKILKRGNHSNFYDPLHLIFKTLI